MGDFLHARLEILRSDGVREKPVQRQGCVGRVSQAYAGSDVAANFYGNDSRDTIVVPRTVGLSLGYKF